MERAGPLRGLWRRGVAISETMKGSSLILPQLGPPVQIVLQQQVPHVSSASTSAFTILTSHFKPCRRVRQHSSHTICTISEHGRSRRAGKSPSDQRAQSPNNGRSGPRFETRYMHRKQPLPRSSNRIAFSNSNPYSRKQIEAGVESKNVMSNQTVRMSPDGGAHLLSDSHATQLEYGKSGTILEPAYVVVDQDRSSQNGAHLALDNYRIHKSRIDKLKVELERVGNVKSDLTRSLTASDVLEIREPELLFREEEWQSPAISEEEMTGNLVTHDLITEELLRKRKVHWMDGRSTPARMKAGLNLITQGRVQSRASYGSRDWSRDTSQGNGTTHMHSAETTSEAIAVLQNRLQEGNTTDSYAYVKVLQMCLKQENISAAKQIHECVIQSGMDQNTYVATNLLSVYMRCGRLQDARRVFDELKKKSVITWTTMIAGYAESDQPESALELFKLMREEGVRPNEVTYLSILKACASPSALKWGKEIHECIRHASFESDVRVGTALLQMYAKCGCITKARRVFENLTNRNAITWSAIISAYAASDDVDNARRMFNRMKKRNLITWNIMIGAYAESGRGVEAYRLFLEMRREGFEPDAITYLSILNPKSATLGALDWVKEVHGHASKAGLVSVLRVGNALVHMYAESGSIDDARLVFDRMQKRDVVTWTVMIAGLAEHGHGREAYQLFIQMRREGLEPNAITYVSILSASASVGALEWVKVIHGHAIKAGLELDLRVSTALVHMYAKCGSIDHARRVFDRIEKRDVVTWTAMISGLAHHGCGHEALALFGKMNADLVKPNGATFVAVLSACCHAGLLDDGRRLFSSIKQDYGIEPDIVHYTCMVDLLGRAGHLNEARQFINDMPVEPDAVTWIALLGACRTNGNVELGELAAEEVFKLAPNDSAGYVLLSNIYAAAGKWEKVSLMRTMMQKRGVWKEPGCSWIEVDEKIHEFVSGDTSHPEAEAIYTELNKLTEKLKAEGYVPDTLHVLHDISEEDKELALCSHSEKLAIAYGVMRIPRGEPIRIRKNLRVCPDCHTATKFLSKVTGREIITRDLHRFHHFKDGVCSCGDYW